MNISDGNRRLRDLISENVPKYLAAQTKTDKGQIIVEIVERIRRESPTGVGMVRMNPKTGRWSFIGIEKAKDKIGHALRKASQEAKSQKSSSSKCRSRKAIQDGMKERDVDAPVKEKFYWDLPPLSGSQSQVWNESGKQDEYFTTSFFHNPEPSDEHHHRVTPTYYQHYCDHNCGDIDHSNSMYNYPPPPPPPPHFWDMMPEQHYQHQHHAFHNNDSRQVLYSPI